MGKWRSIFGLDIAPVSHSEKWISFLGGGIAVTAVYVVSAWVAGPSAAVVIVASAGASTVILFATPHSPLAQPWPVVGGHVVSAVVGVCCAQYISDPLISAGVAVGGSILAMFYLRCLHPPGGATALAAVVGGDAIHALGFQFVVTPILLDAVLLVLIAVVFNNFFSSRRYPAGWHTQKDTRETTSAFAGPSTISHEDFVFALSQLDTFVDISEEDLLKIYDIATGRARSRLQPISELRIGIDYSNGKQGEEWSVRRIVDEQRHEDPSRDLVIYRVVAGAEVGDTACVRRSEFLRWAKMEWSS